MSAAQERCDSSQDGGGVLFTTEEQIHIAASSFPLGFVLSVSVCHHSSTISPDDITAAINKEMSKVNVLIKVS